MKFGLLLPSSVTAKIIDALDLNEAMRRAGFEPTKVDFGIAAPGVGYVCYEYALFAGADPSARYWTMNGSLCQGNAVFYGFDEAGATVDLDPNKIPPIWAFATFEEAEKAVEAGKVRRPSLAIDDEVLWQWPQPKPKMFR